VTAGKDRQLIQKRGKQMEEIILKMAKAIQAIEHKGWHDWESCHEVARERALKQAKACFDIMSSFKDPH